MRRSWLALVLFGSLTMAACGPAQVVVTAEMEVEDPETGEMVTRPITDMEVEALPFDRDQVFDSLEAAFPEPEPEIPEDLLTLQDSIRVAQEEWRALEAEWSALRDRLQGINEEMEPLARGEAAYVALYREFQDVEERLNAVDRQRQQAFERFTDLQGGFIARADSMNMVIQSWADEAFADAGDVFITKLEETGRDIVVDTTDAQGAAQLELPPGQWWVHARHELPFQELYWNVPITVEGGDPMPLILNRENAQIRPKL